MKPTGADEGGGDGTAGDLRRAVEAWAGLTFTDGNTVDVLRNGDEIFPAMLEAIRTAKSTIDIVTFVYWTGDVAEQFAHSLAERARAGVAVRVLLDAVGSRLMRSVWIEEMREAGCDVQHFRPPVQWRFWRSDHRTHRKILVVDHEVAFTGGVGIAEEWEGDARDKTEWRDTHVRLRGPVVDGLRAAFIADWKETGGPVATEPRPPAAASTPGDVSLAVVDDAARVGVHLSEVVLEILFARARTRIRIQTPYFLPPAHLSQLLIGAARRGIVVQVVVPGDHFDKRISDVAARGAYHDLVRAGVEVYRYGPTMMHVKCVTIDRELGLVGSVNLNHRSLRKDEEVAVVVDDDRIVAMLDDHFDRDVERSDRVSRRGVGSRQAVDRVSAALLRPFRQEL